MMRVLSVVGARPQFIKASALSERIAEDPDMTEVLVHTGQHYDDKLSRVFFDELGLREPDVNLGAGSDSHGAQTARMLSGIEIEIQRHRPDQVLVYGDTNSTVAGALAAVKLGVPVVHVEAGLRAFDMRMPEEINRRVSDHVSDLLCAPSSVAASNLIRENVQGRVEFTGDVMLDVVLRFRERAAGRSSVLQTAGVFEEPFALVTIHRAENTDDLERLGVIVDAFAQIANELAVVWPLHPRTRRALTSSQLLARLNNVRLMEPAGYLDLTHLQSAASVIVTDSGGIQKEAFFHEKPCVTVRDRTEWTELTEAGWNRLAPPRSSASIVEVIHTALRSGPGVPIRPYGDGAAAARILSEMKRL